MTARASANNTSDSTDEIAERLRRRRTRDPSMLPSTRFERIAKAPGSKELILGRWVDIEA